MYEEKTRRKIVVNWKSLLIKLAILLVVVFIIIWIISLFNRDQEVESNFGVNFEAMRNAATEYFTGSRLPKEINESVLITLGDMFDQKLLVEFQDEYGNSCDISNSYAEATKIDDSNYRIEVRLVCDNESDTVINTVEYQSNDDEVLDEEPNDDVNNEPNEEDPDTDIDDNSSDNNSNGNNNSSEGNSNTNNNTNNNSGNTNNNSSNNQSGSSVVNVTSISLNYKRITLDVGESRSVALYVYPVNATNKKASWQSSNTSIATVSNGVITGHRAGTVIVTVTVGGKSTTLEVVVKEESVEMTCRYGDGNYNTNYILSVDLRRDGCAVNPNVNYTTNLTANDYISLIDELSNLGFDGKTLSYRPELVVVKNNAGTGVVGLQLKIEIQVKKVDQPALVTAVYIINADGSRTFLMNNVCVSGVCIS